MPSDFSNDFPACRMITPLTKDEMKLPRRSQDQIDQIEAWIMNERSVLNGWGLGKKLNSGFLALFHGPSGTGKKSTAAILGQSTGLEVYRIDVSTVLSKYIGETEKNLSRVFDEAEKKGWILFFDEADALFGKRTEIGSANDRYANQEVSYLLQRIETYTGVAILATNSRSYIDDAFLRRLQSMVAFTRPNKDEQKRPRNRTL